MKKTITSQINTINDAITWIRTNRPEQFEQRFLQLVEQRSRLRKIAAAQMQNPAIAAYGESQKGKSYVITNLLSDNGAPFTVKAPDRDYDFVKEINPITNNVEATGVVTRFTTFADNPGRYCADYPVLVKLLTIGEIATILCDGYHSDLTDYQTYSDNQLAQIADEIYSRYSSLPEQPDAPLTEDDVLDMQYYLRRCTGGSTQALLRSPYFNKLALVARRIPASDRAQVLAPLWHRNATLTNLFIRLSDALGRLNYAHEVYLPIEAVLNTHLTLMSVQRINELGSSDKNSPDCFTDVVVMDAGGNRSVIRQFDKSELSALCAEAVFKVEDRFLNSTLQYDLTMVAPDVQHRLDVAPFAKNIIAHTDLLDFPGARARNQLKEENLDKTDTKSNMSNDANVYLRGKVAYLFNRYSDTGLINVLLFCHDNAQRSDDTLYITIENWVKQYVGDTPQSRRRTIELAGGVSPFFLVATKFNIDMAMGDGNVDDVTNSRTAIDQRWADRFNVVLYKEVLHGGDAEWFGSWITEGETFKNTYLLRDYKYSGDTGKGNNLYSGFFATGRETASQMPDPYYERLRTSFVESPHVQKFFADPEAAWDAAATINNDGALYLFHHLATAASHTQATRRELTSAALRQIGKAVYDIVKDYHHDEDAARQLVNDMNRACAIRRELLFACNADNYFFGRLISNLQTTEKRVYNIVYDLLNSTRLNAQVNSFDNYELIRKDIGARLDRCSSADDNAQKWECLMIAWGLPDRQSVEEYLSRRGVKADLLFSGAYKPKQNSVMIADAVFENWISEIKSPESIAKVTEGGNFDPIEMAALVDNIVATAVSLDVAARLERSIAEFVNVMNPSGVNISAISDQMASIINEFVGDLGYNLRSAADQAAAARIIDENPMRFDPLEHIGRVPDTPHDEQSLTELFNRLYANPEAVTPAFEHNYYRWIEYMIVTFLLRGQLIDYDIAANKRLGQIIDAIQR